MGVDAKERQAILKQKFVCRKGIPRHHPDVVATHVHAYKHLQLYTYLILNSMPSSSNDYFYSSGHATNESIQSIYHDIIPSIPDHDF